MSEKNPLPKLVTFDGEARSGKGTIVQASKDYLRESGLKVMLIDRGQTFRVLVVAATKAGVDVNSPEAIKTFLDDEKNLADCTDFVKTVYRMPKDEREELLYTNEVGANSAKIGAQSQSQVFVADLTKKWLADARDEGFEVVLIDGRALEQIATEMDNEELCEYVAGLYFVCDPQVGARRTLGYAGSTYDNLADAQKDAVDELVEQINERNRKDRERTVEPIVPPTDAPLCDLPNMRPADKVTGERPMLIIDTSAEISKEAMSLPVAKCIAKYIKNSII